MWFNRSLVRDEWEIDPFVYRIGDGKSSITSGTASILQAVCEERGWKEFSVNEDRIFNRSPLGCNLLWKTIFTTAPKRSLYSWQYVNYIPRAIGFCNKGYLAHHINSMQGIYGTIFDFCPTTFVLPEEFGQLHIEHKRRSQLHERSALCWEERAQNLVLAVPGLQELENRELDGASVRKTFQPVWISKPIGKSQGKGIIVLNDMSSLPLCETHCVIQEYIARPLLIAGHKFDLRLYVVVPSTMPLTIYVYNEGLTRFAVEKYDLNNLTRNFSHLTNATLNKMSPEYSRDKDCLGVGCKWTLQRLRQHLRRENRDDWFMWQRIISIIILSLVGEFQKTGSMPHSNNSFEFLGYDILLDEDLRPWLLEVNHSPGLNADCKVDHEVKNPLLHDLFNLLGLPNLVLRKVKTLQQTIDDLIPSVTSTVRPSTVASTNLKDISQIFEQQKGLEERFVARNNFQYRLLELTTVYSQNLTSFNLKPKPKSKKKLSKSKPVEEKDDESVSSTSKRNIKLRDWVNPIKKCGGWVRVFPFDEVSFLESRGRIPLDTRVLINHIYCNLKKAREITLENPMQMDEAHATILKVVNKLTTEVWIPPY